MATLKDLERALINADKAGDSDAARKLAAAIRKAREENPAYAMEGVEIPWTRAPEAQPSLADKAIGAGEAALSVGTGTLAMIPAAAVGVGETARYLGARLMGNKEAAAQIEQQAPEQMGNVMRSMTYAPRTEQGRESLEAVAKAAEPLQAIPGIQAELAALSNAARLARPVAGTMAQQARQSVSNAVGEAAQAVKARLPGAAETPAFGKGSVGAAQTPEAIQRRVTAESLPVPFKDESALTTGQATRDFAQQQFEKETAKRGDMGAPLRERASNQTATLLQNFDSMVDQAQPITLNPRDIGKGVDQAIVNKANVKMKEVSRLYNQAREAGQMAEPVSTDSLVSALNASSSAEGTAPVLSAARRELVRLGGATQDEAGNLVAKQLPINDMEELRKFINATTKQEGPDLKYSGDLKRAIDSATESAGGDIYQKARQARAQYAREFENVGITSKLLDTKRGTTERQIALGDVFDKIILDSPLEEMNKVRRTLITAGPEGKQAWQNLKAKTIDHIKEQMTKGSGMDERGQPLVSPAKLKQTINSLDQEGKLEGLFGKKQAQQLRDLSEIAQVIYTAPPGSVNFSNTASALQVALDAVGTGALTGLPIPAVTAIKEATKYVKNRQLQKRVNEALGAKRVSP